MGWAGAGRPAGRPPAGAAACLSPAAKLAPCCLEPSRWCGEPHSGADSFALPSCKPSCYPCGALQTPARCGQRYPWSIRSSCRRGLPVRKCRRADGLRAQRGVPDRPQDAHANHLVAQVPARLPAACLLHSLVGSAVAFTGAHDCFSNPWRRACLPPRWHSALSPLQPHPCSAHPCPPACWGVRVCAGLPSCSQTPSSWVRARWTSRSASVQPTSSGPIRCGMMSG